MLRAESKAQTTSFLDNPKSPQESKSTPATSENCCCSSSCQTKLLPDPHYLWTISWAKKFKLKT